MAARPSEIHDEPVPMRFSADERPFTGETFGAEPRDVPERSRPAVLPVAVVLIAGLLLGFMAGYFVGGRETIPPQASSTTAAEGAPATQPSAPATSSPPAATQSSAAAPPAQPAAPPPTVSEDPTPAPSTPTATTSRTPPAAPVATTGRIVVRSNPEKAGVMVNGRWRGRTPLTLENMPFGKYTVRVVQPGYKTEQSEF